MEIYRVGGSVRDELLGIPSKDLDYVVVGSSQDEMLSLGFTRVGKDFPVYLHPETNEEYALARQERLSNGKFEVSIKEVSLEEDLLRRDLTINAIAIDSEGKLIDPYGGCKDLAEGILRPTSRAFIEDPLRILRVCRLRTTLGCHWKLDPMLYEYAFWMIGLYKEIPKERIHQEVMKAFKSPRPSVFFKTLNDLGILKEFFPELYNMTKVEHDNPYHMEGSVFNHTMLVLDKCRYDESKVAALLHDIGKAPCKNTIGTFHGHSDEQWVIPAFKVIRSRYGFSSEQLKVSEYVALNHHRWQNVIDGTTGTKKFLKLLLTIRTSRMLVLVLDCIYADMNGRFGIKKNFKYQLGDIIDIWYAIRAHKTDCTGLSVDNIIQKVHREKLNLLEGLVDSHNT